MSESEATGHRFVPTSEPDVESMVLTGLAVGGYAWQAEIVVEADPADLAEEVAPSVGTLEPVDGGTLLRLGANDLAWIARFLAGLPFAFEIRSPVELRRAVRDHARALQQRHR
jgi:predicted DNA-binding transcriptional regulator YafY